VGHLFSVWSGGGQRVQAKTFIFCRSQEIKDAIELGMAVNLMVFDTIKSRFPRV
jgi:hypothetical protein